METTASTGKRAVWYIVGLNLIAAAVVLNVRYNVGVAAFSSVMYAISEIYRISLGTGVHHLLSDFCSDAVHSVAQNYTYLSARNPAFVRIRRADRCVRLAHSCAAVRAAHAAALLYADHVCHRGRRISVREEQNGAHADRRYCEHHFRSISSAVFRGQELV